MCQVSLKPTLEGKRATGVEIAYNGKSRISLQLQS